ncbi:MAG: hypothetical protein ACO1TE_00905 [Prosthecobacter sp.]
MKLEDIPNLAFRQLVASLSTDIVPSSARTFELCLGEERLAVRVLLHPDQRRVVMQAYAADLSMVLGDVRAAVLPVLMLLNQAGLKGRPFFVALDARDFVCVTRIQPLDRATGDEFLEDLDYLAQQALEVRTVVTNLALQGADITIKAVIDPEADLSEDEDFEDADASTEAEKSVNAS